ncbi:hypothetical protein JEQ12_012460 [Ovis aries]|uniref:Proline-rich protein 13 n=1 Tax=Ovis aries TaxID=9940 RepID=A0A835ZK99_SHEEP|nr:hypothetical protein JEQ12_012460 [Ovis aries]
MWNPNARQPGPYPHPPNTGHPGGCNPSHAPPANAPFPPGPFPTPPGAPQGNPAFPPVGPVILSLPSSIPGPGMRPVNPLVPGIVGPGIVIDQKVRKKMKKHSSSSSSSSNSD